MGPDDQQGRVEPVEVVEFGGSRRDGRPKRPWPTWLPIVLAVGIAIAALGYVRYGRSPSASPTRPPAVATPPPSTGPPTPVFTPPAVTVTEMGHPLLGVTAGWEVFGRSLTSVVRVELARGRITETAYPGLMSGGPVFFIAGEDWAMVRPLDSVPGYVVPDGQAVRELSGELSGHGPALPGPDPGTVWVQTGDNRHPAMTLVDVLGRPTGVSIAIPDGLFPTLQPDGAGYLLLNGPGGTYLARPDGVRRVTSGTLMAVGPTRWLALECDDRYRCATVVIDRATGARHALETLIGAADRPYGVISANGDTAALLETDPSGITTLHLLGLTSGADRRVDVRVDRTYDESAAMVWSPDSRWLFVVGADGLYPVDVATAQVRDLGATLPPITQVAIRAGR